jgi:hypothetical protein
VRARTRVAAGLTALITLAALAPAAWGWGDVGHMMVAHAAYRKLTAPTRARVSELLRLNPRHDEWLTWLPEGASAADRDLMIFMIAATWADQIKRDPGYTSDGGHGGNRPEGSPDPTGNRGYTDTLLHKYWHFVDTPFSRDRTPLPPIPTPHAAERIRLFRGVLASTAPDPLKSYDLVWLLHLVGDVHQPLHCVTRVSAVAPDGDDGGNAVAVLCEGCPSQLHGFWDGLPGSAPTPEAALAPALAAAVKLPAAPAAASAKLDEKVWIREGLRLAKRSVYRPPVGPGPGPFALTDAYRNAARRVALERVALAGARLARLLNQELK